MAKKQQQDPGITGVQKIITFSMIAFMGYVFFTHDKNAENELAQQNAPVLVMITDTVSGTQIKSDLKAGKIIIGKWEVELAKEEPAAQDTLSIDSNELSTPIPETAKQ